MEYNLDRLHIQNSLGNVPMIIELTCGYCVASYVLYSMVKFHRFSQQITLQNNIELQAQNEIIKRHNEEKNNLIKEVHHRVKNNLQIISSMLRLQNDEIDDDQTNRHFQEAINRIMTMALIHQKLYQEELMSNIKIQQYLEQLSEDLMQVYETEKKIDFKFDIQVNRVGLKSIVPLGLIYNELVSNTLKYAFQSKNEGTIFVSLVKKEDEYTFVYSDNGEWLKNSKKGFGLELIDTLTQQLESTYELEKTKEGTMYRFRLKHLDF